MTNNKKTLYEDLQPGDLEDLIRKTIEIDTFKPRLDENNVVLAFFLADESPAQDLSRFIEFSTQNVLDTEVSTTPNHNGDYTVYVELSRPNMVKKIYKILQAVSHLTNTNEWIIKAYKRKFKFSIT